MRTSDVSSASLSNVLRHIRSRWRRMAAPKSAPDKPGGTAWSGRFSEPVAERVQRYTASVEFDRRLADADIAAFRKEVRQDYTIAVGDDAAGGKFGGIQGLPTTFIIDREGQIRQKIFGPRSRAAFEAMIKPLLDEAPATASSK